MSRDGVLTFQERIGTTLTPPVASFNDDGTGTVFDGLGISFEADAVINRAVVAGLSGSSSTAIKRRVYCRVFYSNNKHP
jgi:hypothetical protein